MSYLADVAALTRKDLRVELRARDTLPAMLLFVLSTLVVFHFALPTGTGDDAAYGLLWVAIVFTALLGLARAWVPEQEHGVLDGLVLAPCDRSAIWLGKTLATLVFLLAAQVVALPAFVLFFAPLDATAKYSIINSAATIAPNPRPIIAPAVRQKAPRTNSMLRSNVASGAVCSRSATGATKPRITRA